MIHFTPTFGIKDTGQNVRSFLKENMETFWEIFKPYMPYVAALSLIDVFVTHFFMPIDQETGLPAEFGLGGLVATYFFSCLAITWHRVVIHGADQYEAMNPFKPKKSELAFIGMGIALFLMMFAIGFIIGISAYVIGKALLILVLPAILLGIFIWMRVVFYFPAKATGRHISLKQSFAMTKGYVWKMIAGYFMAAIKLVLIMFAFMFVVGFIGGSIQYALSDAGTLAKITGIILDSALILPATLFFQPIFTAIWVTVLSNYYQYVMQNDAPPLEDSNEA